MITAMRVLCGKARTPLEWGCSSCDRDDTSPLAKMPEATRRTLRNCDGETNAGFDVEGHDTLTRCPWSQITDEDAMAVARFTRWKRLQTWPFHGGASEQPATVVEEMETCEAEWERIQQEAQPKPPKKTEPKARR